MNIRNLKNRLATVAATALVSLLSVPPANADPLAIADTPLFLMSGVKPNLIMTIDDSGSMDGELLLKTNDGMAWWRTGTLTGTCSAASGNTFVGCDRNATGTADITALTAGTLNFNYLGGTSATWKKYIYLFPNGSGAANTDRRRYTDATNDHFAIPPLPMFAWSRGPETNKAYFNPADTYVPWANNGDYEFENANSIATEYDPVFNGANTLDLTRDMAGNGSVNTSQACTTANFGTVDANRGFRVFTGMTIPEGACIRAYSVNKPSPAPAGTPRDWEVVRTGGCQVGVTNSCRVGSGTTVFTLPTNTTIAIRYYPATFFLSAATPLPADFGYTGSTSPTGLAPDGTTVLYRYEIKSTNFSSAAAYDAAMQNFANWFMYYRKRHLALRAGLGRAFQDLHGARVAGFTISDGDLNDPNVEMLDIDDPESRETLYQNFYENWNGVGGTPNRAAVASIIRNYKRTDAGAPITNSCQRNLGMLFTDGFSNKWAAGDGIYGVVGNADNGKGNPFQDGVSHTLADATMAAYDTTVRADLDQNDVKPAKACATATTEEKKKLDCAVYPHMQFHAVTLGARGILFNPDSDPAQDPFVTTPVWPTAFEDRHPSSVDDLWHAAINGRGKLLNAKSPADLSNQLGEVLDSLMEGAGSASSAAVNSGSINNGTRLFQASFDATDWSGKLTARKVNDDLGEFSFGTTVPGTVPDADDREIITVNSDGTTAVPFLWANLDATRRAELNADDEVADPHGEARLGWLRGSQANEAPAGQNFRVRADADLNGNGVIAAGEGPNLLGDIINSAPAFVGVPNFRYPDSLEDADYSEFRADNLERDHMVYVGGNDGMLHAFYTDDAHTSGTPPVRDGLGVLEERMAFIPSAVVKNLHHLTDPAYTHRYYVDGSPVTGDAYFDGAWHTMLVSGLNNGGQQIYALDITNPENFTEAGAASVFQWEFDDTNDADLGFTYSRPSIVRMNNGTWAAAFGNGYNSTVNDNRDFDSDGDVDVTTSADGNAILFIRSIANGAVLAKIDTTIGSADDPLGQGRPNGLSTPVFVDVNGDSSVDIAYAGDLFGNLWKFDLSGSNPAAWGVAYAGEPLFTAMDDDDNRQPITSRPNVSRGPGGVGFVVLFGTGKYLEAADIPSEAVNSFYGLLDPNTGEDSDRIASRDDLTEQTITFETLGDEFANLTEDEGQVDDSNDGFVGVNDSRVISDNPIGTGRGWFLDLTSPRAGGELGEKQVSDSIIRNGQITFTTLVPNTDPCENGGSSWLMELKLFSGGRPRLTPWDLNLDGRFDETVTRAGTVYPVGGIRNPDGGIAPKPAALAGEKCDYLIYPDTTGGTDTRCRNPGPRGFGRQSWRQAQ